MQEKIEKALNTLIECAKNRSTTYYGDIYEDIGLSYSSAVDRNEGSYVLGKVNDITMAENNVMISALAVSRDANSPYDGFFKLAAKFGKIGGNINESEKIKFWIEEMERVYNVYKK